MGRFKTWLRKKLVGVDLEDFIKLQVQLNNVQNSELATIKQDITKFAELAAYLVEISGGKGWVQIVQNAILNLDKRIDTMVKTIQIHQKVLEKIVTENTTIAETAAETDKKDLN